MKSQSSQQGSFQSPKLQGISFFSKGGKVLERPLGPSGEEGHRRGEKKCGLKARARLERAGEWAPGVCAEGRERRVNRRKRALNEGGVGGI